MMAQPAILVSPTAGTLIPGGPHAGLATQQAALAVLDTEREVRQFLREEWSFFDSNESREEFAREFVRRCPGAKVGDLKLMYELVRGEYSSFDSSKKTCEYAVEYLEALCKWRHSFEDFKKVYEFAKSHFEGAGNLRKMEWVIHSYVDKAARGQAAFPFLEEAFQFHQKELKGMLQSNRSSADWALEVMRANQKSRLGFTEFRSAYDFAIEHFSALKSKETHAKWCLEIFAHGVPWASIMERYQKGGMFGLGKKEEITKIAEELGSLVVPIMSTNAYYTFPQPGMAAPCYVIPQQATHMMPTQGVVSCASAPDGKAHVQGHPAMLGGM